MGEGGGLKPILAMSKFRNRLLLQHLPKEALDIVHAFTENKAGLSAFPVKSHQEKLVINLDEFPGKVSQVGGAFAHISGSNFTVLVLVDTQLPHSQCGSQP